MYFYSLSLLDVSKKEGKMRSLTRTLIIAFPEGHYDDDCRT